MAPSAGGAIKPTQPWSDCTQTQYAAWLQKGGGGCLFDKVCLLKFTYFSLYSDYVQCEGFALTLTFLPCLFDKPATVSGGGVCGNGVVEGSEDCDCGTGLATVAGCDVCCDPATCKLRAASECGEGACCDVPTCKFKAACAQARRATLYNNIQCREICTIGNQSDWYTDKYVLH